MITATDPRHGTRNGYRAGCRNDCCVTGNREYFRDYYETYRPHLGYHALVDSGPALRHLDELALLRYSPSDIGHAIGIDDSAIRYLYDTRPTVIQQATHDRILALHRRDIVTPLGLRRRVQALATLGWSVATLVRETGLDKEPLRRLRDGMPQRYVQAHVRAAVIDAYDRLHMTPAPTTTIAERRADTRTRNLAIRNRWAPPLAWEHIDDPLEAPGTGTGSVDERTGADLDEYMWLLRGGESPQRAAHRLGVTISAIEQRARREGRDDVVETVLGIRHAERTRRAS